MLDFLFATPEIKISSLGVYWLLICVILISWPLITSGTIKENASHKIISAIRQKSKILRILFILLEVED
jgi:hypothetical protein